MPNWDGITGLISDFLAQHSVDGATACYFFRSQFMQALAAKEDRDVILYASNWVWSSRRPQGDNSILPEDVVGLMAVVSGLKRKNLDLILHTPGGDPTAAEAMLKYLRQKFEHIRVIIPFAAMSAGTVIACGANEIVMGRHSFIGPTDPQIIVRHPFGSHMAPAQALLDDFMLAQKMCAGEEHLGGWAPLLEQYPKGLYSQCLDAIELSRELIRDWLVKYMFSQTTANTEDSPSEECEPNPESTGQEESPSESTPVTTSTDVDAKRKADQISDWLSSHNEHKAHGRFISRTEAVEKGLKVLPLEDDHVAQDLVLSIFHTTMMQFAQKTDCQKIIENSAGGFFFSPGSKKDSG